MCIPKVYIQVHVANNIPLNPTNEMGQRPKLFMISVSLSSAFVTEILRPEVMFLFFFFPFNAVFSKYFGAKAND